MPRDDVLEAAAKSDERVVQAIANTRRWEIGGRHQARERPSR
jgi:hypothetical protein